MPETKPTCLRCGRSEDQVPLVHLRSQGQDAWICPQDLPILIHKPAALAGRLKGAENLGPAEEDH